MFFIASGPHLQDFGPFTGRKRKSKVAERLCGYGPHVPDHRGAAAQIVASASSTDL